MKIPFLLLFVFLNTFCHGQHVRNICGKVVDEKGNPVESVSLRFGGDTVYTDKEGQFCAAYPDPQQYWYYFHLDRKEFFPRSLFVDLSDRDIALSAPVVIRSRKGFWYDPAQIDSKHLGITVKEAIERYKLDTAMCLLWDEPPGAYHHFTTELGDSSQLTLSFQRFFSMEKRLTINDIKGQKITGIGISYTDGTQKIFGKVHVHKNPYFIHRRMKSAGN